MESHLIGSSENDNNSSLNTYSTDFFSESVTDFYDFPGNKIALQFSDSLTSKSKKEICKLFWKYIDEDETFNTIMERGRFINKPDEKNIKLPSMRKQKPAHICELPPTKKLEAFVHLGMDKAAFPEVKSKTQSKERACLSLDDYEESVAVMKDDLKAFDDRVVAKPVIRYSKLLQTPHLQKSEIIE